MLEKRSYLRILAEIDNAAEEVEETLEALEWLEQVDEGVRRQLLVILGGNLNAHLKVGKIFHTSVVMNSNLENVVTNLTCTSKRQNCHVYFNHLARAEPALGIPDILVRIRIPGSVPIFG